MPIADWQARQIRLSVFVSAASPIKPSIEDVFGLEPEATLIEGPNKDFTEMSSLGVGKITVKSQKSRIDWLWDAEMAQGDLGSLGDAATALDAFLLPLEAWLANFPAQINRAALGGVFGISSETREAGYEKLQSYLPTVQLDGSKTSEFLYQINRWALSDLMGEEVRFNRIAKWGTRAITQGPLLVTSSGEINISNPSIFHDATCELDYSSPAILQKEMDGAAALAVVRKLKSFALHTLEVGDVD